MEKRKAELKMQKIRASCDQIRDQVRVYKAKNAMRFVGDKNRERGDVKQLNSFIFYQHDKLRLAKRSEDPNIPSRAFEMTIDNQEFKKAQKRAD